MQQEDASVDKLVRSLNERYDSIDGRISGLEACLRKELDAKASAAETENCFLDASGVRIICAAVNGQLDKLETLRVDLKHKRSMYKAAEERIAEEKNGDDDKKPAKKMPGRWNNLEI